MSQANDDSEGMSLRGLGFSSEESPDFTDIAMRALQAVAIRASEPMRLDPEIDALLDACLCERRLVERVSAIGGLQRLGATPRQLIDGYIPAAAARLGEAWLDDDASFAEVTVKTRRLQEMLRYVATEIGDAAALTLTPPAALVVVLEGQQHTLGASVVVNQFRRAGVHTKLSLCEPLGEICEAISEAEYKIVAISAASNQPLDTLSDFIKRLRSVEGFSGKVVVGGGLTSETADLASAVGADIATNDPIRALRACGVRNLNFDELSWANALEGAALAGAR